MTGTKRIRWEDDGNDGFEGYAGTWGWRLFDVWQTGSDFGDVTIGEWVLATQLPGRFSQNQPHGNDPEPLKAEAERWLERFASSLGAIFPAEDRATVNKTALDAFISEAEATRLQCDQEFVCSAAEQEASDAEFAALVAALGIQPVTPETPETPSSTPTREKETTDDHVQSRR